MFFDKNMTNGRHRFIFTRANARVFIRPRAPAGRGAAKARQNADRIAFVPHRKSTTYGLKTARVPERIAKCHLLGCKR